MNKQPRIEDWFVTEGDLILGRVYDHPSLPDGEIIRTSRVVALDRDRGVAVTKNTRYILGRSVEESRSNG